MAQTKLHRFTVSYLDKTEYHLLKREIFSQQWYYFQTNSPTPVIIDAGAHIGLSTLYFSFLYPTAHITALEPHPQNFNFLSNNMYSNKLDNATPLNLALAEKDGFIDIYSDANDVWLSTASIHKGGWQQQQQTIATTVSTRRLSSLISQPIDLLKLDIEGAEQAVLTEAANAGKLQQVQQLILEYHPHPSQSLSQLTGMLIAEGFQLSFWKNGAQIQKPDNSLIIIKAVR